MKPTFFLNAFAGATILVSISTANLLIAPTAQAQEKRNDAGLVIQIGNGTSIGIQGKIGISEQFSIRPEISFGGSSGVQNNTFTTASPFVSPVPFTAPTSFVLPALPGPATLAVPLTIPSNFTLTSSITSGSFGVVSGNINNVVQSTGSSLDFGIRAAYRF